MDTNRREFLTTVGGAVAAANVLGIIACTRTSGAGTQRRLGSTALDPVAFRERANRDGEFQLAARYWDARVRLEIDDRRYDAVVRNGEIAEFGDAGAGSPDVRIAGAGQTWMDARGPISMVMPAASGLPEGLTVEGDLVAQVAPYQPAILRLVGLIRETAAESSDAATIKDVERDFDTAVGRYAYVKIQGVQYRIYVEEAGQGIPMVLQHTAGSDGRQWRHLLEDTEIQKRFRMIAYDLPFHGKSVPPPTVKWWEKEYRLTTDLVMDSVVEISRALKLDRPVYMGCSVGGYLAPDLALNHPDKFRAVIGVNSAIAGRGAPSRNRSAKADMDTNPVGRRASVDTNYHPCVTGSWIGTRMYEITSPVAPEAFRRETGWVYSQGGPGIFAGDLYYYTYDHDLAGGKARKIDTSKVDVHFLSGEFDPTAVPGPDSMAALAAEIPGATQAVIKGGSHFVMSDDYSRFREYLVPVLDKIYAKSARTT
jgi:pimeloyl-ACP methyl ester carboxylesterase